MKVALVGIGNCASSFVQAVAASRSGQLAAGSPGIRYDSLCGYSVSDIEIVAAFDVDRRKVGNDLGEAIFAAPNCTTARANVPYHGVTVQRGPLLDGVGETLRDIVLVGDDAPVDVVAALRDAGAEVVVNLLPTGAQAASEYYANAAIQAGCGFVNCIPSVLANSEHWAESFRAAGLPLLGDDLKSQFGATVLHRAILDALLQSGCHLVHTHQLNVGGNCDFLNMTAPSRRAAKQVTKTAAIQSLVPDMEIPHAGPSDHFPSLADNKVAYISLAADGLLDMRVSIDVILKVEDSPNAAGVIIDMVRACQGALDRGMAGAIDDVCAQYFKKPRIAMTDAEAHDAFLRFLNPVGD